MPIFYGSTHQEEIFYGGFITFADTQCVLIHILHGTCLTLHKGDFIGNASASSLVGPARNHCCRYCTVKKKHICYCDVDKLPLETYQLYDRLWTFRKQLSVFKLCWDLVEIRSRLLYKQHKLALKRIMYDTFIYGFIYFILYLYILNHYIFMN